MKTKTVFALFVACLAATSVNAQMRPPCFLSSPKTTEQSTVQPTAEFTTDTTAATVMPTPKKEPERRMNIVIVSKTSLHDTVADEIGSTIQKCGNMVKTVLPDDAVKIRKDATTAAKLGFTHILYVGATWGTSSVPQAPNTKLFRATLQFQLYDLASKTVVKNWTIKGSPVPKDKSVADNDVLAVAAAIQSAASNAASILESAPAWPEKTENKENSKSDDKKDEKKEVAK